MPTTLEEYCIKASTASKNNDQNEDCILDDLDPYDNNDDSNSNYNESITDSGNEEL